MATKGFVDYTARRHITYFSSGTMEKGQMLVMATNAYSGIALENSNRYAYVASNPSGLKPIGFTESRAVNYDLTRQKLNPFDRNEVQAGQKISIIYNGWMDTNYISGAATPGAVAYIAGTGYVSPTQIDAGYAIVGKFLTAKDANGYAQVQVSL